MISTDTVTASPRIAERLKLPDGTSVVAIDRVGVIDDQPILFISAYLPVDIGSRILEDKKFHPLHAGELVTKVCGLKIGAVMQTIAATLADPAFAGHLGVEIGAPKAGGASRSIPTRAAVPWCSATPSTAPTAIGSSSTSIRRMFRLRSDAAA